MTAITDQQRQDAYEAAKEWDRCSGHPYSTAQHSHVSPHHLLGSAQLTRAKRFGRYAAESRFPEPVSMAEAFDNLYRREPLPAKGVYWGNRS
jgi:hypothetical protein